MKKKKKLKARKTKGLSLDIYVMLKKQGFSNKDIALTYNVTEAWVSKLKKEAKSRDLNLDYSPTIPAYAKTGGVVNVPQIQDFNFELEAKGFLWQVFRKTTWQDERALVELAKSIIDLANKNKNK